MDGFSPRSLCDMYTVSFPKSFIVATLRSGRSLLRITVFRRERGGEGIDFDIGKKKPVDLVGLRA